MTEQSDFLGGLNGAAKFFRIFFDAGVSLGELMRAVNHKEELTSAVEFFKRGCPSLPTEAELLAFKRFRFSQQKFFVTVESGLAWEDHFILNGKPLWKDRDLTEKSFPVTEDQTGEWECKLFFFEENTYQEKVLPYMEQQGFHPAAIGPQLAFGQKYPEIVRDCYAILALGSVADSPRSMGGTYRAVPMLSHWPDKLKPHLQLHNFDDEFLSFLCYLGVRRPVHLNVASPTSSSLVESAEVKRD